MQSGIYKIANIKTVKFYIGSSVNIANRTEAQSKPFIIVSPKGDVIRGKNLHKFCKENNLDSSSMRKVMFGKKGYISYKGYTKYKEVE